MCTGRASSAARPRRHRAARALLTAVFVLAAAAARAQDWPDRPLSLANGHVTVGGDVTLTVGSDDPGFFNYTDYDRSTLRLLRFGVVASVRATPHLSFLTELRAEGDSGAGQWSGNAYAVYVRFQPWLAHGFELQAGRIPTAFGGFTRRSYGADNLLIGYPLAYQYLTSLRPDAIPRSADDLVAMRGRGWYSHFPVGSDAWNHGVPPVSIFRYDTGVLAKLAVPKGGLEVSTSVTAGTLSYPGLDDENGAPQVAGRVAARPIPGLAFGVSAATGAFLEQSVRGILPGPLADEQYRQRALGADLELSRGYWLVRSEIVTTDWRLPALAAPAITRPERATAWLVEGRYKLVPGWYLAARYDRLFFSDIVSSQGELAWDANLWRVEAGTGYSLRRNVILKGSYQYDRRDGGHVTAAHLAAAQVVLWF
ncbi:MAG TPA: hypothetical protein VHH91_14620 [Vicinamibacterales bacterium]|nr:hypothetical protein [Vicinamibacterales bacterium]